MSEHTDTSRIADLLERSARARDAAFDTARATEQASEEGWDTLIKCQGIIMYERLNLLARRNKRPRVLGGSALKVTITEEPPTPAGLQIFSPVLCRTNDPVFHDTRSPENQLRTPHTLDSGLVFGASRKRERGDLTQLDPNNPNPVKRVGVSEIRVDEESGEKEVAKRGNTEISIYQNSNKIEITGGEFAQVNVLEFWSIRDDYSKRHPDAFKSVPSIVEACSEMNQAYEDTLNSRYPDELMKRLYVKLRLGNEALGMSARMNLWLEKYLSK